MNRLTLFLVVLPLFAACGSGAPDPHADAHAHAEAEEADFERGPHHGRLLRDGEFTLEVMIFETHVPPQFRLYAWQAGRPVDPREVEASIELSRLGGERDLFTFTPEDDHLTGSGTVVEPHSFDVKVTARHAGQTHTWSYASYEGRTSIPASVAEDAGIEVEAAGPAVIRETVRLMGVVAVDADRRAVIRARFPGIVREVAAQEGERVRRGQTLVRIEGNDSLRTYPVTAPFDGVVLSRDTSVGDVAGGNALMEIADLSRVWIDLRAVGTDADRLAAGQHVRIASATGSARATGTIQRLLPVASAGQGVIARAVIPNPDGTWRPGMTVSAEVTIASREVPLAVKEEALQGFRDFTVVFAQVGETYEVRMLELGERDGEHAEVLGGLAPGTPYVTAQSFLIKADIEKSGASHDH